MKFAVVIEQGETSFGAHIPDLPGCVAVGETRDEVLKLIEEAIEFHIEGLREDGLPIPPPSSSVEFVEVTRRITNHGAGAAEASSASSFAEGAWFRAVRLT
jgi:predicted RNase H-like HicB family nuclease